MPEIQWTKLSRASKQHLLQRLKDRQITASDLQALQGMDSAFSSSPSRQVVQRLWHVQAVRRR